MRILPLLCAAIVLLIDAGLVPLVAQEPEKNPLIVESPKPDYPRIDLAAGYQLVADWPQRPAEYTWGMMPGMAVDREDRIWTFNRGDMPVQVYTADGKFVRAWGRGQIGMSHHIKIDPQGNVWLADIGQHVIRKFTPGGELLLTLGTPGAYGADATHLNMPTDMAITPEGDVFVSDGYGNNRVLHYAADGKFVKTWGRLGVAPGEFSQPHAIAIDSQGRLYVADRNNVRVQVFDRQGKFLAQWVNLITPWGITVTPRDEVFVCGSAPMRWEDRPQLAAPPSGQFVMKFTTDGRIEELWNFPCTPEDREAQPGELKWVHAIAVDSRGDIYLGDIQGRKAQKFRRLAGGK